MLHRTACKTHPYLFHFLSLPARATISNRLFEHIDVMMMMIVMLGDLSLPSTWCAMTVASMAGGSAPRASSAIMCI